MVTAKVSEAIQATGGLLTGASFDSGVWSYRKKVRANSRRLLKSYGTG